MKMTFSQYSDNDLTFNYSREDRPDPGNFRMHSHECCELYYFESGSGIFHIEGTEYPLQSGDILVMRPAEAHYIEIRPEVPYTRFSIHFDPELLRRADPSGRLCEPFFRREPGTGNHYSAERFPDLRAQTALETLLTAESGSRAPVLVGLLSLVLELQRAKQSGELRDPSSDPTISRIIRYLNDHHTEPLSLASLCHTFGISRSVLCRLFHQATGASIGEYVTVKRLAHARELLREGVPVMTTATACGFQDYSVFYRAYRKRFGCCPRQLRQE